MEARLWNGHFGDRTTKCIKAHIVSDDWHNYTSTSDWGGSAVMVLLRELNDEIKRNPVSE